MWLRNVENGCDVIGKCTWCVISAKCEVAKMIYGTVTRKERRVQGTKDKKGEEDRRIDCT